MSAPLVAVIATEGFSPFHLSVPEMIFSQILPGDALFRYVVCAENPGIIPSKSGMSVSVEHGLDTLNDADIIIIPFWAHPEEKPSVALLNALLAARLRGANIVGLCLGTYVLAYAGLLDNHRAATHWEFEADFTARFPCVQLDTNSLYVDDDHLITSAGTAAGIDCCLYVLRKYYGSAVANKVARRMVIPPYREGGQAQFIECAVPKNTKDSRINALLDYLRGHLDKPHDVDSLANFVSMARRTFTRNFTRATGVSPVEWLQVERLRYSQTLLESTDHSVEMIASLSGFNSPVSYRQGFKQRFGVSPSEWRKMFRGK